MTRIIYGVSGEGSGHSSRARVIAKHLQLQGHQIKIVSYDRGYRNLKDQFDVFETQGLHIASADNKVSLVKTFTDNLGKLSEGHSKLRELRALFKEIKPHCVITDFEPMTAYLAHHYDLPLISLDNQHSMRYMYYTSPPDSKKDRLVTESIIRAMVPKPDVSIVTTFFKGPLKNQRTFLFPPILRDEIFQLKPHRGDHILVYLTSGFESFIDLLKSFPRERFLIYGYDREHQEGPCIFRRFSSSGFLKDLASARAVMATAGFTLISEALFLKKPYLALPMQGQYEQEVNAFQLEDLSLGQCVKQPSREAIGLFLYDLPRYEAQLNQYSSEDNRAILERMSLLMADDAAEALVFHRIRKEE